MRDTELSALPDFGVPYRHDAGGNGPVTEFGVPRNTYYGFVNREFAERPPSDIGTISGEIKMNENVTPPQRFPRRAGCSQLYRNDSGEPENQ